MADTKKNAVWKCIVVLAAIALCSGLLLGFTGASFSEMTDEEGQQYENGRVIYYAVSDDGEWHAFLAGGNGGYGGEVQVYLYFRGTVLEKLAIGENGETYLSRLEDAGFYDQFLGKEVSELSGMEADVVSGATRSSQAVGNAVAAAVQYFTENVAGGDTNE